MNRKDQEKINKLMNEMYDDKSNQVADPHELQPLEPEYKELVELIAHEEHIRDDVAGTFPNLDSETQDKIVYIIQNYIGVAAETALENPDWFEDDN